MVIVCSFYSRGWDVVDTVCRSLHLAGLSVYQKGLSVVFTAVKTSYIFYEEINSAIWC